MKTFAEANRSKKSLKKEQKKLGEARATLQAREEEQRAAIARAAVFSPSERTKRWKSRRPRTITRASCIAFGGAAAPSLAPGGGSARTNPPWMTPWVSVDLDEARLAADAAVAV